MPRKAPDPPTWHDDQPGPKTITLQLKLITPMFGGGYEPRHIDTVCPIRAASIRGHLRFWWRALYGGRYRTPADLFEAEEAMWGTMSTPGKVGIRVHEAKCGEPVVWAVFAKNPNNPAKYKALAKQVKRQWPRYALHPFQGQLQQGGGAIAREPDPAIEAGTFGLRLTMPGNLEDQVKATVAAWVRFGGIGARTRRGCGSLVLESGGLPDAVPGAAVHEGLPVTLLSGARLVLGTQADSAVVAWKTAVETYAAFRQMRYPGHPPMPGRSKWPEPDSIRRIENHPPYAHEPWHPVLRGFPRADLGLPIVFHFKDPGDPAEHILQPPRQGATRFASPVITKPVPAGSGKYRPMIAVLGAPHAWELGDLDLNGTSVGRAWIELSPADRAKCEPLAGKDVRTALLEYAAKSWKAKVEAPI